MDKPLPQATDIEKQVLGNIILTNDSFYKVCDLLTPDVFYLQEHHILYDTISKMFEHGKPVDLKTLTHELKHDNQLEKIGGAYYLSDLTDGIGSDTNIEYHSRVLVEKYLLRELIKLSNDIQNKAFDMTTDVFELQDQIITDLTNIQNFVSNNSTYTVKEIIPQVVREVEAANSENKQIGIKSSFDEINNNFGGYVPKLFYLIAGRPGMGKSTFIRNEIHTFARNDIPGILFTLEMTKEQIIKSMISADKDIPYDRLVRGGMSDEDWTNYNNALEEIESLNIFINESGKHTIQQIYLTSKRLKLQHNIGYIIIDHLQLVKGDKDRYLRMCDISSICKDMAKELELPVIGLSQLNREVEKRQGKKPQSSDLRESGTLEQDADCIFLVYRPEYYGILEDGEGESLLGKAKFINTKNRDGAIHDFRLIFEGNYQRFTEYEDIINVF